MKAVGYDMKVTVPLTRLLQIARELKANPDLKVDATIPGWFEDYWDSQRFWTWFHACLNNKINRNTDCYRASLREDKDGNLRSIPWRNYTPDGQSYLRNDRRRVEEYVHGRIRSTGSRGILRSRYMQKRYPHINIQESEE